jgi:hypothetical protein
MKKLRYYSMAVNDGSLNINQAIDIPVSIIKTFKVNTPGFFSSGTVLIETTIDIYVISIEKDHLASVMAVKKKVTTRPSHSWISLLICSVLMLIFVTGFVNSLPAPVDKAGIIEQIEQMVTDGKLVDAANAYNENYINGDKDWETLKMKIETLKVTTENYYFENKNDLVNLLKFNLSVGPGAGYLSSTLFKKYDHIGDEEWLNFKSDVDAAVAFDAKVNANIAAKKQALKMRKQNFKDQFSQWDGSHYASTEAIKEILSDPNSYEHVETHYDGDYRDEQITVRTKFRAKNSYGVKVTNTIAAVVIMNDDRTVKNVKIN